MHFAATTVLRCWVVICSVAYVVSVRSNACCHRQNWRLTYWPLRRNVITVVILERSNSWSSDGVGTVCLSRYRWIGWVYVGAGQCRDGRGATRTAIYRTSIGWSDGTDVSIEVIIDLLRLMADWLALVPATITSSTLVVKVFQRHPSQLFWCDTSILILGRFNHVHFFH